MNLPTDQTHAVEAYIRKKVATGLPPTRRDIQRNCGISSTSVVTTHLNHLVKSGVIVVNPSISRGIGLVEPTSEYVTAVIQGEPVPSLSLDSLITRIKRVAKGRAGTVYFKADAPKREAETP